MMTETSITVSPSEGAPQVKSDPGQRQVGLNPNLNYLKTLPGILKLIQAIIGIICMASSSPARLSATDWFLFVVVICFASTVIWIFIYILSIREALQLPLNWTLMELMNTLASMILYITAFILQLSAWSPSHSSVLRNQNLTAGCFGMFNAIAYAAGAYYLYKDWKYFQSNSGP